MKNLSAETATIRTDRKYANIVDLNMDGLDISGRICRWMRMSDDLISRKFLLECAEYDDKWRLVIPYEKVKNAPTAFDKEKVTQELKSNMESAQLAQSLVGTDLVQCGGFSYGYYNGVKDAIKIVEEGGIE